MINAMADVEVLANKATWAARRRTSRLHRLRADLASGDTHFIEANANRFLAKNGFNIERGGNRYRELCFKLLRADIEQLERYAERDRGDYTGKPKDPIVDVWIMDINDEEEIKRTKNQNSKRAVPIHLELIRIGFLKHSQSMTEAGEKQVFPEIEIPEVGQIAAQFSREFNRYLADIGVKTSKKVVAYSLRHTFTDRLRFGRPLA